MEYEQELQEYSSKADKSKPRMKSQKTETDLHMDKIDDLEEGTVQADITAQ